MILTALAIASDYLLILTSPNVAWAPEKAPPM